ncbi:MAG: TIGR03619 family F420-dependent LLM class oxidoreductase [Acidimicrobiaceae bacterium]|jgi:probable F420-dependent oxidoreductase|nr:TIGR03619 family F420-dependent LLM class oxidoreductase [Acidimicrobiaceae bacterium]MCO4833082.1 TIGR03619 family F420-dependent LLM class oxidoreductase [Acidimicrobiaceae bacterium]MDB4103187.1 TIGR03619 family F420-dependent LLM class oxidoreductase [Acidimicrobiales bacterium]MDG1086091.1 TIGR03619 family F420-dependent LLM class oxidoreductase [Acidimicrobiales bacterium]
MRFGYLTVNAIEGIRPDVLASELEQRGFDSLWVPEHSHVPVSRKTPYPAGGDLPEGYWRMMDPFVSLAMAAQVTSTLELCTGICLLLEHDVLDLACTTATLDALSGGRLRLGVGVGWNEEELANHRPDLPFKLRYSAMEERVAALRTAWKDDEASFEGRWDRFSESWVYPKPIDGTVPVALGNAGPLGIEHAARYADEWCPIDASMLNIGGRPDPAGAIDLFRSKAAEAGRPAEDIPISIFSMSNRRDRIERYGELGADRVVFMPKTMELHDADATLRHLDELADMVTDLA